MEIERERISVKNNKFTLDVAEPASTGFRWRFGEDAEKFEIVSSRLSRKRQNFGGSLRRLFRVKIVEDHPERVVLELVRPWDAENVARTKVYELQYFVPDKRITKHASTSRKRKH